MEAISQLLFFQGSSIHYCCHPASINFNNPINIDNDKEPQVEGMFVQPTEHAREHG
jgi:hypothetical protein